MNDVRPHFKCFVISIAVFCSSPSFAQNIQPASAIPWLTDSLESPQDIERTTEQSSTKIETISVETLKDNDRDGLGILSSEVTGFPNNLWSGVPASKLLQLLRDTPYGGVPAIRSLYRQILLSETTSPEKILVTDSILLARIDKFLEIGALSEAQALIELVGPETNNLFRRWFDISLLTNNADNACAELDNSSKLSPVRSVQVFCLALNRNWEAAATSLALGEELKQISKENADLLAFFLDESLLEEFDPPSIGSPLTPLEYVIRESVGLPRPTSALPVAFVHAELAEFVPLRFRMEAAEVLVREGVLPSSVLFASYREEDPAASGGVWERMAATQAMDAAATADEITESILKLDREFKNTGLRQAAADEFILYFSELPPDEFGDQTRDIVAQYLLLADAPELAMNWISQEPPTVLKQALSIATGSFDGSTNVEVALKTTTPEEYLSDYLSGIIARGQTGEALMSAIDLLARNDEIDEGDLIQALVLLRATGQEKLAGKVAVQTLLLPLDQQDAN